MSCHFYMLLRPLRLDILSQARHSNVPFFRLSPWRPAGIFEVNPRIGGDLVFECPKKRARSLFEKLNFMF